MTRFQELLAAAPYIEAGVMNYFNNRTGKGIKFCSKQNGSKSVCWGGRVAVLFFN